MPVGVVDAQEALRILRGQVERGVGEGTGVPVRLIQVVEVAAVAVAVVVRAGRVWSLLKLVDRLLFQVVLHLR